MSVQLSATFDRQKNWETCWSTRRKSRGSERENWQGSGMKGRASRKMSSRRMRIWKRMCKEREKGAKLPSKGWGGQQEEEKTLFTEGTLWWPRRKWVTECAFIPDNKMTLCIQLEKVAVLPNPDIRIWLKILSVCHWLSKGRMER